MNPKVSIIVPIYNVEKYLSRCIESLLNQTLKDVEIILVNDGSPDNCPAMCDEYAKMDSRVKVIHKQNAGQGYARNSGLEIATGQYVAFVDSDDYVDIKMYETLYEVALENGNADSVSCGLRLQVGKDAYRDVVDCKQLEVHEGKDNINRIILDMIASKPYDRQERKYELSSCTSIFKSDIVEKFKIRFVSEREFGVDDFIFKIDYWKYASIIVFIPDIYYQYCLNTNSFTQTFKPGQYNRYKNLYNLLCDKTKDFDKSKLRANRLFIGYIRAHILCYLVASNLSTLERRKIIIDICDDPVWKRLYREYPPRFLPVIPRIIYYLICTKRYNILFVIAESWGLVTGKLAKR